MDDSFDSIIRRLQAFIDHTGMSFSQFADTCAIPRPTLSQLLGGRTKSINDVLLSKFCRAFPQLNVAWLLFGQGDMLQQSNIEISEAQTGSNKPGNWSQDVDMAADSAPGATYAGADSASDTIAQEERNFTVADSFGPSIPYSTANRQDTTTGALQDRGTAKAVSVIVLYDNGTFRTFKPA